MTAIDFQELKRRAGHYINRVAGGEIFDITRRGRPVARLGPIPDQSPLDRLRSAGEVWEARGNIADLPAPLKPAPGMEAPSRILERLRADER